MTKAGRILANPLLNKILGVIVSVGRSVPFIILLVAIIPLTRFIVGTSIGTIAAIVPLTVGCIPFIARLVEGAPMEVPDGLLEAAKAMGQTPANHRQGAAARGPAGDPQQCHHHLVTPGELLRHGRCHRRRWSR